MTPQETRAKAQELYKQRQFMAGQYNWNASRERKNLLARCRSLAKQIPVDVTHTDEPDLTDAMMYLDVIATREDVYLEYAPKREKAK